jgi:hypothetical protein
MRPWRWGAMIAGHAPAPRQAEAPQRAPRLPAMLFETRRAMPAWRGMSGGRHERQAGRPPPACAIRALHFAARGA